MSEPLFRDLLITDDDIALDLAGFAITTTDRDCIAQDICHMIRESGLLISMIGERDAGNRKTAKVRLSLLVESDYRIKPGTVYISETWLSREAVEYVIWAETLAFGRISFIAFEDQIRFKTKQD